MKKRHIIEIVVLIVLALPFVASGLIGSQSKQQVQKLSIENTIQSSPTQDIVKPGEQFIQEKSIYSKTTLILLIVAVIGIVAFRRNSFS